MKKLQVMVTDEELEAIKRAARASNMSASNYMRIRIGLPKNTSGGPQPGAGRPRKQKTDPQD